VGYASPVHLLSRPCLADQERHSGRQPAWMRALSWPSGERLQHTKGSPPARSRHCPTPLDLGEEADAE
jgi:hypothetical protein